MSRPQTKSSPLAKSAYETTIDDFLKYCETRFSQYLDEEFLKKDFLLKSGFKLVTRAGTTDDELPQVPKPIPLCEVGEFADKIQKLSEDIAFWAADANDGIDGLSGTIYNSGAIIQQLVRPLLKAIPEKHSPDNATANGKPVSIDG